MAMLLVMWGTPAWYLASPAEEPKVRPQPVMLNLPADGLCEHVPFAETLTDNSRAEMIRQGYRRLIERLSSADVTHLLLNVNYQRVCYPSRVWDSYWDVDDPGNNVTGWPRKMWLIHKAGVDPYRTCIELCRARQISPWVSMRMNDTHYVDDPHKASSLWSRHPEYRTSARGGLNFAIEEVRRYHLALIEEILERYDVDGIELDWMRFCHHFKAGQGRVGCEDLTRFMREVVHLTKAAAGKRGHDVRVAARVPAVPEFARGLGIDGVSWVQQGLVDVLILSSTWMPADRNIPIERWHRLIGDTSRPYQLAACMGLWVRGHPGGPVMRNNLESARGFTANMIDRGAGLIYVFNHFNLNDFQYPGERSDGIRENRNLYLELLRDATRLESAVRKPRRHIVTFHDTAPPGVENRHPLPVQLRQDQPARQVIWTGPKPARGPVVLRVGLGMQEEIWDARLETRVNGALCSRMSDLNRPGEYRPSDPGRTRVVWEVAQVAPRVVQFAVPVSALKRGANTLELRLVEGNEQTVTWIEMVIAGQAKE